MPQKSEWKAFLVQTTTGVVGPEVALKEGSDYSIALSKDSTATFILDKAKTNQMNVNLRHWLDAWWSSILITFQDRAIFCGPMVSNPKEYASEIRFDCMSVRGILKHRVIIKESDIKSPSIASGVIQYNGKSLGTIAQDVVKLVLEKPGGNLPIEFVSPRESASNDADHQRTYKAYNAMTLDVDAVLTKLSEVGGGPDIMFRPRLIDSNSLVWDMHHGTEHNPRISQKNIPTFDLTAPKTQVGSLEITQTGTYLTDRVIAIGGGTNEAAVMAVAEDLSKTAEGYPLLETVINTSDTTNKSVVLKHAQGTLNQNRKPLKEFTLFVDAVGRHPLGTYWPGDLLVVYTEGFYNVPDGPNKMRLLNMTGSFGSNQVRLALQLDDQWLSG